MRYLVTQPGKTPFYASIFDLQNNYVLDSGMIVFDLYSHEYYDGDGWKEIIFDTL